jgi:hypothetical protein
LHYELHRELLLKIAASVTKVHFSGSMFELFEKRAAHLTKVIVGLDDEGAEAPTGYGAAKS